MKCTQENRSELRLGFEDFYTLILYKFPRYIKKHNNK